MANQQYVSRFLTKNWECEPDRILRYYDSQLDRIAEAKSRDLFAESDLHSEKIERRLSDLIEDPLGRLWHRVRKEGVKEVTDWREIRAAHLIDQVPQDDLARVISAVAAGLPVLPVRSGAGDQIAGDRP